MYNHVSRCQKKGSSSLDLHHFPKVANPHEHWLETSTMWNPKYSNCNMMCLRDGNFLGALVYCKSPLFLCWRFHVKSLSRAKDWILLQNITLRGPRQNHGPSCPLMTYHNVHSTLSEIHNLSFFNLILNRTETQRWSFALIDVEALTVPPLQPLALSGNPEDCARYPGVIHERHRMLRVILML